MEFFIALFGGLYLIGKLLSERSKEKSFDRNAKKMQTDSEELLKRIAAPPELIKEVQERILANRFSPKEILNEVKDDLRDIFGDDSWEEISFTHRHFGIFHTSINYLFWIKQLILSKQGKIHSVDYYSGFPISIPNPDLCIRFCKKVEENFNNAGINVRLVLEPRSCSEENGKWNPSDGRMIFEQLQFWEYKNEPRARLW